MKYISNKLSDRNACQEKNPGREEVSGWQRVTGQLAHDLIRATLDHNAAARERFYGGFWRLVRQVAVSQLRSWNWRGDVHHDAEELASDCVRNLLRQEARGAGIFAKVRRGEEIQPYFSGLIWRTCRQRARRLKASCADVSLDELLPGGEDGEQRTRLDVLADRSMDNADVRHHLRDLMESLREDRHGRYRRLPAGMTPLDCVLDVEMVMARDKGLAKRTLQRYAKDIRDRLAREVGLTLNARGFARSHRPARRPAVVEMDTP
jgi:hypothetical protein